MEPVISIPKILILAIIQGATELLPVSSSAHVIVAEKLMGLDPTAPALTLLLVMLHTGTMLAVVVFFWTSWKENFFASREAMADSMKLITVATIATGFVFFVLAFLSKKLIFKGLAHPDIESLFGNLLIIAAALAAAGALILCTGFKKDDPSESKVLGTKAAFLIGLVQGFCVPFRGFSRSGATISTGLLLGIEKKKLEGFSFALAVILTPAAILKESLRLLKAQHASVFHGTGMIGLFLPGLIGMVLSFISGILALKWLSSWLEAGRWYWFGFYCLFVSAVILILYCQGL
jgi:undecaprenyl-diphosphatase